MRLRSALLAALLPLALAGCSGESRWASEEEVQRALYRPEGPSKITLFTVQSTRSGSGAHSGLMVSGPHRALFDPPAGVPIREVDRDAVYRIYSSIFNFAMELVE